LEEIAVLHLPMTGSLEVVQSPPTGGSLITHMWNQ